mgnify:CR=1 FL=1
MNDFVKNYFMSVAKVSSERRQIIILGLMAGLRVQYALLENNKFVYDGFWLTVLKKSLGKTAEVAIRHMVDMESFLSADMLVGWKEVVDNETLVIYTRQAAISAIHVSSLYDFLVESGLYSSEDAKYQVAKYLVFILSFLEKEYQF